MDACTPADLADFGRQLGYLFFAAAIIGGCFSQFASFALARLFEALERRADRKYFEGLK